MKKISKIIIVFSIITTIALTCFGCGTKNVDNSTESKTCLINSHIVGYDTDWLKAEIAAFNTMYASEGYEVKLELEDSNINAVNEIKRKKTNDIDLYFDYNSVDVLVESSQSIMRDTTTCLLEDLSDVLDSKAITANKSEETGKTIKEKIDQKNPVYLAQCKYNGISVSQDRYPGTYAIPYGIATTGIYVNKKALIELGYSMDDLLTTDAMFDMCDDIVKDYDLYSKDYNSKFFPIASAQQNAGGYVGYMFDYWLAQYMGVEDYQNFWKFVPKTGTVVDNGYSVYENYGILETLRAICDIENVDLLQPGYASTLHTAAQGRVFVGTSNPGYQYGSLLMVSGDWMYKESSKDYAQYLNDVIAIKTPILSSVGMKLGLCGHTHAEVVDGYTGRSSHCKDCETKLRQIVKLIDEYDYTQKTNAEIAQLANVPESSVEYIRTVRGVIIDGDGSCVVFMPSYSNAKTVAKLFLRFIYSSDGQKIFEDNTYVSSLVGGVATKDVSTMNDRELSIYNKTNSYNTVSVSPDKTNKLRNVIGSYFPNTSTNLGVMLSMSYSHKYSSPQTSPETIYVNNMEYIRLSWGDYVHAAGL